MRYILLILVLALAAFAQNPVSRVITCTDAGASDTYTCTPTPTVTSLTNVLVLFTPNTVNTGAATLQIDSTTATSIVKASGNVTTALRDGDLQAGQKVWLRHDGTNFQLMSPSGAPVVRSIGITIDGRGSAITTGVKGVKTIPFACTITSWEITSLESGSLVIDAWKDAKTNGTPTVADTITASAKPTLSAATNASSSSLPGWTTSVAANDIIVFNVDSASTTTWAEVILYCVQ